MGKYSAIFHIGWMTVSANGEAPMDLVREIDSAQNLQCLVQMADTMGTKKDKKEIGKLIVFLEKYTDGSLTIDDIRNLDVNLSIGTSL